MPMLVFRTPFRPNLSGCAVTIGNFDGVHCGHQVMLQKLVAKARALNLPAAVMTFEPHPRELFSPDAAPARLTSLREKLELFAAHGVDQVYICHFNRGFASLSAEHFVDDILTRQLGARYILIGDDFQFGAKRAGNLAILQAAAASHGFEVEAMHSVCVGELRVSSTAVREALAGGDMELAAQLLGRPYSISGRVLHGDKIGRTLGFPTANIQVKHNKPPLTGICVVQVHGLRQGPVRGVASLGVRPTINNKGKLSLEVNIFDFAGDIYGQHLRVDFLHKLRDEEKYPDLDTLTQAIARDVANARDFFAALDGRN